MYPCFAKIFCVIIPFLYQNWDFTYVDDSIGHQWNRTTYIQWFNVNGLESDQFTLTHIGRVPHSQNVPFTLDQLQPRAHWKYKFRNGIKRFRFELNVEIERANSVRRGLLINILLITCNLRIPDSSYIPEWEFTLPHSLKRIWLYVLAFSPDLSRTA